MVIPDQLRSRPTIALLMALTALGQLGVNLALPALPVIGRSLGIASADTALVLSTYLLGLAAGQLVVGPLSDRFGRRVVLLAGLALFVVAASLSALAQDEASLLGWRIVQGLGASAPLAIGRAVARDLFDGAALVRVTALMTMAMAVVPGLAPALGGVLTDTVGWRGALGTAGLAGLIVLALTFIRLPETNLTPLPRLDPGGVLRLYGQLVGNAAFARHTLSNALVLAALYAFFAGAPRVLIGPSGLSASEFGLVPVATGVTYLVGGWALLRAGERPETRQRLLITARAATLLGCLVLLALAASGTVEAWGTTLGAALYALGLGAVLPVGVAGALIPFRKEAGTASALLGALQMGAGSLAGATVGWMGGDAAFVYPAVMLFCVVASAFVAPRSAPDRKD